MDSVATTLPRWIPLSIAPALLAQVICLSNVRTQPVRMASQGIQTGIAVIRSNWSTQSKRCHVMRAQEISRHSARMLHVLRATRLTAMVIVAATSRQLIRSWMDRVPHVLAASLRNVQPPLARMATFPDLFRGEAALLAVMHLPMRTRWNRVNCALVLNSLIAQVLRARQDLPRSCHLADSAATVSLR
jgi:hypothetical protein